MRLLSRCHPATSRRRANVAGLFLAVLPLACAAPAAPRPAASPVPAAEVERIELGFAWPESFSARVTGAETSRFVAGVVREESSTQMSYRVRVEPAADGVRVRYDDFALLDPRTDALVRLASVPGLEALGAALRPSFLVSKDGHFAGTPDLDRVANAVNRELEALRAQPSGPPADAPRLPARFSGELFRRHAPADWEPMVELWTGREIELGARYAVDLVTKLPLLEGVSIRMTGELRVSGWIPCAPSDSAARCVELVLVTQPAPGTLDQLRDAAESRSDPTSHAAMVTVDALELDERVRIVTEPETLVPHRVSTDRRARLALRLPDGSLRTSSLDEEKDLVFDHERS